MGTKQQPVVNISATRKDYGVIPGKDHTHCIPNACVSLQEHKQQQEEQIQPLHHLPTK